MRPEKLYLLDILDAAKAIERFCANTSEDQFLQDEILQSAVLQKLIVIGEAASHLPSEFRETHPEIAWLDIIGFRNIAVHQYFAIMWEIVWTTAIADVPDLKAQIAAIIETEFIE
jgi:uncharacterized protein with HEPN domain